MLSLLLKQPCLYRFRKSTKRDGRVRVHLSFLMLAASSISKKSNCKISNTKSNCNFGSKNCSSKTGRKKIISELHANKRHTKNTIGIIVDAKKLCHQANGKPRVMPAPTLYMYISAMGGFRGFTSPFRHETPGGCRCVVDLAWLRFEMEKKHK